MIKLKSRSPIAALALVLVGAAPAHALISRAWVSGHGTDAAGCGAPTSPCRSFQYVHDNILAAGGEIDVLDPAGYGSITITKAISIVNDGVGTAGVQQSNPGQDAITINAGTNDRIYLRGLEIEGLGVARAGIVFNTGGQLTVKNCVVQGFKDVGINVQLSSAAFTGSFFLLADVVVSANAGDGIDIWGAPSTYLQGVLDRVVVTGNQGQGVHLLNSQSFLKVTVADSMVAYSGCFACGIGNAGFMVEAGIFQLAQSTVAENLGYGVVCSSGAACLSAGNNFIYGNGFGNVNGTLTNVGTQ